MPDNKDNGDPKDRNDQGPHSSSKPGTPIPIKPLPVSESLTPDELRARGQYRDDNEQAERDPNATSEFDEPASKKPIYLQKRLNPPPKDEQERLV